MQSTAINTNAINTNAINANAINANARIIQFYIVCNLITINTRCLVHVFYAANVRSNLGLSIQVTATQVVLRTLLNH